MPKWNTSTTTNLPDVFLLNYLQDIIQAMPKGYCLLTNKYHNEQRFSSKSTVGTVKQKQFGKPILKQRETISSTQQIMGKRW